MQLYRVFCHLALHDSVSANELACICLTISASRAVISSNPHSCWALFVVLVLQAVTIYLSFIIYPKPYSHWYLVAAVCIFGGMGLNIYTKNKAKIQQLFRRLTGGAPDEKKTG